MGAFVLTGLQVMESGSRGVGCRFFEALVILQRVELL
jgi:hypothetical protein